MSADAPWGVVQWPPAPGTVLRCEGVSLAHSTPQDAYALFRALDDDTVWAHVRGRPHTADELAVTLADATAVGRFPWTVREGTRVVGTTSFLDVSRDDARLEIGFTVYAQVVWGTAVNPACKLALLTWAFEHGFGRVQLKTDVRNTRSQQAIARLGAQHEGVLRRHQRRADGSIRDSVLFSVTVEDWPSVRAGLLARLAARRA